MTTALAPGKEAAEHGHHTVRGDFSSPKLVMKTVNVALLDLCDLDLAKLGVNQPLQEISILSLGRRAPFCADHLKKNFSSFRERWVLELLVPEAGGIHALGDVALDHLHALFGGLHSPGIAELAHGEPPLPPRDAGLEDE